jgi:hypothetical protein
MTNRTHPESNAPYVDVSAPRNARRHARDNCLQPSFSLVAAPKSTHSIAHTGSVRTSHASRAPTLALARADAPSRATSADDSLALSDAEPALAAHVRAPCTRAGARARSFAARTRGRTPLCAFASDARMATSVAPVCDARMRMMNTRGLLDLD